MDLRLKILNFGFQHGDFSYVGSRRKERMNDFYNTVLSQASLSPTHKVGYQLNFQDNVHKGGDCDLVV